MFEKQDFNIKMEDLKKIHPAIIIHGGAGPNLSSEERKTKAHESLKKIVNLSYQKLIENTSAIDVVVFAAMMLEDDPQFNAGTGAKLQSDGAARLSASLMDGYQNKFAGVINMEQTKNPILVSKELLTRTDRVLSGEGATQFARMIGLPHYNPVTTESLEEWSRRKEQKNSDELTELTGTIGVACVDVHGHVAVGTSTGGKGMEIVGRVSDSATIAGNYASCHAAVSCTGIGEELVEHGIAVKIVTRVDDGKTLQQAFEKTFLEFRNAKGRGGAIGVDAFGNIFFDFTTEFMLRASKTKDLEEIFP